MRNENKYRLDQYLIREHAGMFLTWESHITLGSQLSGRCFTVGNILLIGPSEKEEVGYLIFEFQRQIEKLPVWGKTRYYCFASCIHTLSSGQNIVNELIKNPYIFESKSEADKTIPQGIYCLDRYKIIVENNNEIYWEGIGQHNNLVKGNCFIESDILFIGPEDEKSQKELQIRREFLAGLKLLPKWNNTFAWGLYGTLRKCEKSIKQWSQSPILNIDRVTDYLTKYNPSTKSQQLSINQNTEYARFGLKWSKKAYYTFIKWKIWSYFGFLIKTCVLIILLFLIFLSKGCVSIFSLIKNQLSKNKGT